MNETIETSFYKVMIEVDKAHTEWMTSKANEDEMKSPVLSIEQDRVNKQKEMVSAIFLSSFWILYSKIMEKKIATGLWIKKQLTTY